MFVSVLIKVVSIFLIILAGGLARRKNFLTDASASSMAICVTNFFYPALIVSSITSNFTIQSLISNWVLPAGTIIIMLVGYITGILFVRLLSFDSKQEKNTFLFQCTINNYVFLPLPIVAMFFGNTGVAYLIFSSFGSEISVWTIGMLGLTGNRLDKKNLKNLLSTPVFSLIFSIIVILVRDSFGICGIDRFSKEIFHALAYSIEMLGKATVPLALFLAGSRISKISIMHLKNPNQFWIIFLRLIFIPALSCTFISFLPISHETFLVLAIVAIMPAAIASIILADAYRADIEFASASVLTTHIVSLVTIPAWLTFLTR
ncbi:MAG: AEC family transporter [Candidatus Omnitrophica bacterium]|nr:AEC family transporter [Candidatus Omnitrophota bacterium]